MEKKLSGKKCAITGAGKGIGRAAATLFSREGCEVFIVEADKNTGMEAERKICSEGGKACFIECDISNYGAVKQAFEEIKKQTGILDVLYNNASVFLAGRDDKISEIEQEDWERIIGVNLNGLFHCCKFAMPLLLKSGCGSIINTASSAGLIGIPKCDAYTAAKGAAVSLTRSMAVEYGPLNVRVNCIAPAAVATDMVKQSNHEGDDFDAERFINLRTPLRRWGNPEEVAKLALFLASDDSSYINGAVIPADAGITINGDLSKRAQDDSS